MDDPSRVRTLRCWHCKYRSLAFLESFTSLVGLEIATWPDADLESLSGLSHLEYLRIIHLPKVTSLQPLAALNQLKVLRLETSPGWDSSRKVTVVDSLQPIGRLEGLENLELFGIVPQDRSLASLEACRNLRTVRVHVIRRRRQRVSSQQRGYRVTSRLSRVSDRAPLHQPSRNGLLVRSRPIVVSGPWPGSTRTPSSSVITCSRIDRNRAGPSPPGRSKRPIEPANS